MNLKRTKLGILSGTLTVMSFFLTTPAAHAQTNFSVGIGFGPGYLPPPPVFYRPPIPGPGYNWVNGYYSPYSTWIPGYWAAPFAFRGYGYGFGRPRYYGNFYRGYRGAYGRNFYGGRFGYGRGWRR